MKIVITESPTKATTISQFLEDEFEVVSCQGHIRDLPKGKLGLDIEDNFKPQYVIPTKKRKLVNQLKKKCEKAEKVILAADEDREGEAIAWHLKQVLGKDKKENFFSRIAFHEVTPQAVKESLKHPREIDLNLVFAQQARRGLDRLVGYELSPLLWEKVASRLSAGRVQSPALRLIVEREEEREKFKPQEYWTLSVLFDTNPAFEAELKKINNIPISKNLSEKDIKEIIEDIKNRPLKIKKIEEKINQLKPPAPFITSSLQIEANRKLGFTAKRTMAIAQRLYEGLPLKNKKSFGLITYLRTDSPALSQIFVENAGKYIKKEFGEEYFEPKIYKTKSTLAQEAHEGIRPTDLDYTPEKVKPYLKKDEFALYELIFKRALASLMSPAKINITKINLEISGKKHYLFRSQKQTVVFPGYLALYEDKQKNSFFPKLNEGENLSVKKITPSQHFTEPPARYNDASLIKKLTQLQIGRPSTYVPIIKTLEERNYVKRENGYLKPQEIGKKVNLILINHFPNIVDYSFTAKLESDLDKIAEGKEKYENVLKDFYFPFKEILERERKNVPSFKKKPIPLEEDCPECGAKLAIKTGRFGEFIACSNFPKCRYSRSLETYGKCPKCGKGEIVKKMNKRKQEFYACNRWPLCHYIGDSPQKSTSANPHQ